MSDVITILDERVISTEETVQLKEIRQEDGTRHIVLGQRTLASEAIDEWARCAKICAELRQSVLNVAEPAPQTVALLGGGLALIPRILGTLHTVTVFEAEAALAPYSLPFVSSFVAGRWQETLLDHYDVLIFDTGETPSDIEMAMLQQHATLTRGIPGAP